MDVDSFEELTLSTDAVGEAANYLPDGLELEIVTFESSPIGLELPVTVDMEVVETEPGVRGDTATGASKQARLVTGLTVQVPLFVDKGDVLRVDTRTGEYQSRA